MFSCKLVQRQTCPPLRYGPPAKVYGGQAGGAAKYL